MAINIVDKVINGKDLKVIEAIAEKYDMSLVEFGRFIGKLKNEKGIRSHVRFSEDELKYVDAKVKKNKLDRSKYCKIAYQYFMQSDVYKKIDIMDLREDKEEKSVKGKRVCVSFADANEYLKMKNFAKGFSIPFATLIRYCALNYPL